MSVEFKAEHVDLLMAALESLAWKSTKVGDRISVQGGKIELDLRAGKAQLLPSDQPLLNKLKVAYSQQAIRQMTLKNRWQNIRTTPTKGVFQKVW